MTADTTLSVREAVAYVDDHYSAMPEGTHLISERHMRRLLTAGVFPCTRTPDGHLGITVAAWRAIWEPAAPKAS